MAEEDQKRSTKQTRSLLEEGGNVTIVTFGDSISAGFAVRHGFPDFWKDMLEKKYPKAKIEIVNQGVCGDTSLNGLGRLEWSVMANKPDLVTINFGINDMYMGFRIGEFKSNIIEIVDRVLEECGCEVILLSSEPLVTPSFDEMILSYYQVLKQTAEEMDVGFVDVYSAWMKCVEEGTSLESLILPGLDHPNEAGYRIIAEEMMQLF